MTPFLAELPAELLIWVVIGVVWAVAQIFAKRNKERKPSDSRNAPRSPQRGTRPTPSMDPVSPNDELRDFLRKISGELHGEKPESKASEPPRQQEPHRPPPVPTAAQRPTPRDYAADRRRHEPRRQIPVRPQPLREPAMQSFQSRERSGSGSRNRVTPMVASKPGVPRRNLEAPTLRVTRASGTSRKPTGFGNWRAAIIHREIIGPPRALHPYSANEF